MPKPLATAGIVVGLGLIAWWVYPQPAWQYAGGGIAAAALLAAVIDWLVGRAFTKAGPNAPLPPALEAGPGHVDQRVTSFGQSGGINAHTVNQGDGERQR